MSREVAGVGRRSEIAEAGIRIIASRGVRALTHRAIDTDLELPAGSTSYYARTRRDLVRLIVQRLATRTSIDLDRIPIPDQLTVSQAATLIASGLNATLVRSDEHLTRIALHIEYRNDPDMIAVLAGEPPLRPRLLLAAGRLLARLGISEPAQHANDLVALMDSLLMQRAVRGYDIDIEAIVRAYLAGVVSAR